MWKIIKLPILYLVVQFGILFLCALFFTAKGNDPALFSQFLQNNQIYIVFLLAIIWLPILIKQYKKQNIKEEKTGNYLFLLVSGIILSLFTNVIFYYVNSYFSISNLYTQSKYILVTLIATGIIGPIIEELLFRGIMYNEARKRFTNIQAILLVTTIFALFHANILQMVYAFALGFILIYVYLKYQNIKAPIILHMASNITTTLFIPLLIRNIFIVNYIILIICIILITVYWWKEHKLLIKK